MESAKIGGRAGFWDFSYSGGGRDTSHRNRKTQQDGTLYPWPGRPDQGSALLRKRSVSAERLKLPEFALSVFINCPFDDKYAGLLEAMLFCIVSFELEPRLANEELEAGQSRLDKILRLSHDSKYSIHDLSLSKANVVGEPFRMNMPFEYGLDFGFGRSGADRAGQKRFLVFEKERFDLKQALSDTAGQDVEFHKNEASLVIEKTRNFFRVQLDRALPGGAKLEIEYATFLGWMTEKKISEGHSESAAKRLPTRERLDEMRAWLASGKPDKFVI